MRKLSTLIFFPKKTRKLIYFVGNLPIQSVNRILLDAQTINDNHGFLDHFELCNKPESHLTIFTARETFTINLDVYRKLHDPSNTIFEIHCNILTIGNTSWLTNNVIRVRTGNTDGILAIKEEKCVLVDKKTRRPTQFPDWFFEKYKKYKDVAVASDMSQRKGLLTPPTDAFMASTKTRYSDYDGNFHVNSIVYYQYCLDAATEAAMAGYYRHFIGDMCWYPIAETDVTYLGECLAGDELKILTWQDSDDVRKVYFSLYVKDKNVLQASMVFDKNKMGVVNKL